ncbi:MAG: hypothetical protein GY749_33760 [Desulfobacteraceae bacterium]|nr:hypothetical protein [Desulfobacteraceae bacterium]
MQKTIKTLILALLIIKIVPDFCIACTPCDPPTSQYTMTIHAKVQLDTGQFIETDGSMLEAFKEDECRGTVEIKPGPSGKWFQLLVKSNSPGETGLLLKICDGQTGQVYDIKESFNFASNETVGEIFDPVIYTAKEPEIPVPDLTVLNLTVNPTELKPGSATDVSCTVKNQGKASAGSTTLKYYLSDNPSYESGDTELNSYTVSNLAINETNEITKTLTIPSDTSAGTWYILFVADADNEADESNEDNNVAYNEITIISQHFTPVWEGSPNEPMNLQVTTINYEIEVGDEIGVFDEEKCVGTGIVKSQISEQSPLTITTSLDDGQGNGFTEGHEIRFLLWDSDEQAEKCVTPCFIDTDSKPLKPTPTFEADTEYKVTFPMEYGNIDHKGTVDLNDAILGLKVTAGIIMETEINTAADVNCDGKIGTEEVIYILHYIMGK